MHHAHYLQHHIRTGYNPIKTLGKFRNNSFPVPTDEKRTWLKKRSKTGTNFVDGKEIVGKSACGKRFSTPQNLLNLMLVDDANQIIQAKLFKKPHRNDAYLF